MKTYEVLEKALALIEDEKNWCGEGYGDGRGSKCAVHAVKAVCPGFEGAFCGWTPLAMRVVKELQDYLPLRAGAFSERQSVPAFNDTHSHAAVVALFQEAIRNEKAKEGMDVRLVRTGPAEPTAVGAEPCLR